MEDVGKETLAQKGELVLKERLTGRPNKRPPAVRGPEKVMVALFPCPLTRWDSASPHPQENAWFKTEESPSWRMVEIQG